MSGEKSLRLDRFGMSKISWIDCVQIEGHRYSSNSWPAEETEESYIDKKNGMIIFNVAKKVGNPSYKFRNGDATYLEVGTAIYSVKDDEGKIAALDDRGYRVYVRE